MACLEAMAKAMKEADPAKLVVAMVWARVAAKQVVAMVGVRVAAVARVAMAAKEAD